jgi:non-ribosomal peptide synthase protein (TIGR01720 family)
MVPSRFEVVRELPRTASGKVDRRAVARGVRGEGEEGGGAEPRDEVERMLAGIWREVLGVERVSLGDHFFELGGDSILGLRVVARARQSGMKLSPGALFEFPLLADLAAHAREGSNGAVGQASDALMAAAAPMAPLVAIGKGVEVGARAARSVPLTPIEHWFFDRIGEDFHHWNLPLALEVHGLSPRTVERALGDLVARHDALRLRFDRDDTGAWRQRVAPPDPVDAPRLERISCAGADPHAWESALEESAVAAQSGLDLSRGPLLRAVWLEPDAGRPARLLVAAHHLIVDVVSWRVLAEEMERACAAIEGGRKAEFPQAGESFALWAERLSSAASGFEDELPYWLEASTAPIPPLPRDGAGPDGLEGAAHAVTFQLSAEETHTLLNEARRAHHSGVEEMLLTALFGALARWNGSSRQRVEVEGHGRETGRFPDLDLSRSVGWFTILAPLAVDLRGADDPAARVCVVKEARRAMPGRGLGWGVLRWLQTGEATRALREAPQAEVSFNYLGMLDAGNTLPSHFQLAAFPVGPTRSPRARRTHLVEVDAHVLGGVLELRVLGSTPAHRIETLERFAAQILDELRTLLGQGFAPSKASWATSDFPESDLEAAELERLLSRLAVANRGER